MAIEMSLDYSQPRYWRDKPEAWKEIMPGVKRRILAHSLTGLMVFYQIEAGKTIAWHNHPHSQFGVIIEGEAKFRVGDSTWNVKSGDTYVIPPAIFHEFSTVKNSTVVDFFTPERQDYLGEALSPDSM